jgi:hypothetical protein
MTNKAIYTFVGISLLAFWSTVGMAIYLVMG